MTLICYKTNDSTGWEQFDIDVDVSNWISDNPDKTPTHVFRSGPQYQIDTIEQARFNALCHEFGFRPEHYRRLTCRPGNDVLELYGFGKDSCLFRDIRTNKAHAMAPERAHAILGIPTGGRQHGDP